MKSCETMAEVRAGIDRIDRMIVALLAERVGYIEAAAHLKRTRDEVRDEARIREVLVKVRGHAREMHVPEELVTALYEHLVEWCIAYEFELFDARTSRVETS